MDTTRLEGRLLAMAAKAPLIALHKLLILCSCYGAVLILLHVITVVFLCRVISQMKLIFSRIIIACVIGAFSPEHDLSPLLENFLALIAVIRRRFPRVFEI